MIKSKNDLFEYMQRDMYYFNDFDKREQFIRKITHDSLYEITKYVNYLRKEEYYYNVRKDIIGKFMYLFLSERKTFLVINWDLKYQEIVSNRDFP